MRLASKVHSLLESCLVAWVSAMIRHRWLCLALIFLLTCGSGYYTIGNLGVNTDTKEMLSADLQFRKDYALLNRSFPEDARAILVVIRGSNPEQTDLAVRNLGQQFSEQTNTVESVYTPNRGTFFDRQALLFLDVNELDQLALEITRAQPFLGRLSQNNSLDQLLNLLNHAIPKQKDSHSLTQTDRLLLDLAHSVQAALQGGHQSISWQKLMLGSDSALNQNIGFILVAPRFDYSDLVPAERSIQSIRAISHEFEANNRGVSVRLTGEVALEHDELESISKGTAVAGAVSLVLVCLSLVCGLRSIRLATATLITLVAGLILSAAFATLAVGSLNLISIAFAVLYIGLGVDYAIHLCLRTQEMIRVGMSRDSAVIDSARCLGPSLILCCLTTSMGFYSFVPTAYQGVSELGVISGTAMFIGLFITLSLLPALLVTLPGKEGASTPESNPIPRNWHSFPVRHRRLIKISTALISLCGIWSLSDVAFDFDPVSLRDQGAESVTTFRELLKNKETSPLVISVIANNEKQAREKIEQLQQLDSVDSVLSVLDFMPRNQEEKLELIEALDESLGPLMGDFPPLGPVDVHRQTEEFGTLLAILESNGDAQAEHPYSETAGRLMLRHQLKKLLAILEQSTEQEKQELLETIQNAALKNLAGTIAKLTTALNASTFDDLNALPESFLRRWLSQDGLFRLQVQPRKDLNDLDNLREFVEQVQEVAPNASDLPVIYSESGKEVVKAFQQATTYAIIAISLISLIVLGNIRETGLVLMPLFLTAILTGASTVLFDNPFNFANIIVLPLLLGLGVDSSIHIVHRLRLMKYEQSEILKTSTARGIFFSGLTTVFSFTSLAFISHAGTASLGLLLTIGILLTLTCTLVVLPAFAVKPEATFS